MDASESDAGADQAAAEPVDSGPAAPQPGPPAAQPGAPQPGDAAPAAAAAQPGDAAPTAAQAALPADAALAVAQAALPGDVELAATVRSVDEGQVQEGVPLTVLVGGTLFVGELVSAGGWWAEAERRARGAGGDAAKVVSELSRQAVIMERRPVGYLHMRNAVMGSDRRMPLLRIRLPEVQAWAWGVDET